MTRTRLLTAAAVVAAALALAGCDGTQTPDGGGGGASDEARSAVVDAANEFKIALKDAFPDAGFVAEPQPGGATESSDCSGSASDNDRITWSSQASWYLDSRELTAPMLDPIIKHFTADGWEVTEDETDDQRLVRLARDGYTIQIAADTQLYEQDPTRIRIGAYSPCLDNPDQ